MKTNFEYTGGIDAFSRAYLECALWTSIDEDGAPLDATHDIYDFAPAILKAMYTDCETFVSDNLDALANWDARQAGHDFWLTRNGHGAGFWDRGMPTGEVLTNAAEAYGERDLYVGDDSLIHQE